MSRWNLTSGRSGLRLGRGQFAIDGGPLDRQTSERVLFLQESHQVIQSSADFFGGRDVFAIPDKPDEHVQLLVKLPEWLLRETAVTKGTERKRFENGCAAVHKLAPDGVEVVVRKAGVLAECRLR